MQLIYNKSLFNSNYTRDASCDLCCTLPGEQRLATIDVG